MPAIIFGNATKPSHFDKVHNPLRLPRDTTSERPKVVRTWRALYILTPKCALRHNGMHFFDIATSESVLDVGCFVHLTSKCASRHNVVHFSTSQLLIWPAGSTPTALARLLFDPPDIRLKSVEKQSVARISYLFAHLHLLSSDSFF